MTSVKRLPAFALLVLLASIVSPLHASGARRNATPSEVERLPRGVVALTLGRPASAPPALDENSSGWADAVRLERFYRAGGDPASVTPVAARVAWDAGSLYVLFRCSEPSREAWAIARHTGKNAVFAFGDRVDLFVRPRFDDERVLRFSVTSAGRHEWSDSATEAGTQQVAAKQEEGYEKPQDAATTPTTATKTEQSFAAEVRRDGDGWTARLVVPWRVIGDRPAAPFGLSLGRAREQSGEQTSPLALDFNRTQYDFNPPANRFMEASFGDRARAHTAAGTLAPLPSGARFWQRPALLVPLSAAEKQAIWRMQATPAAPTTPATLAARAHLAQRWHDLLMLEGYTFNANAGGWMSAPGEYTPRDARAEINRLLRLGDEAGACRVLDVLLRQFDRESRGWFADSSPGDIRREAWSAIDRIDGIETNERDITLRGRAGTRPVTLRLTAPATGGIRLSGDVRGFFDKREDAPLRVEREANGLRFDTADGARVRLTRAPFAVTINNKSGAQVWRLAGADVRFMFDAGGKTTATDVAHPLAPGERVYGFGERFNSFDQRGNVVTLWQIDAWEGNMFGIRNQAYKQVPLFHSTRGYTEFLDTSYRLRADVGQGATDQLRLTAHGDTLDLRVWTDDPSAALRRYTDLTGKPLLPPRWAFEPWAGGGHRRWNAGPKGNATAEILAVMDRFRELDIPHSAVYAEGSASADPRLYAGLARQNIRILTWSNSTYSKDRLARLSDELKRDLPALRRPDGSIYAYPEKHPAANRFPYMDFSHPRIPDALRSVWKNYLDLGVAGSMVDFGDQVPEDSVAHDGRRGSLLHNAYAYDYHRSFAGVFRERRGDDHILFARGGSPGSQRFVAQFAGDHQANMLGFRAALVGGLNLAASGFSTWGCDIGGFRDYPDRETYIRWVQWGAFSPLMRAHGTAPREPWEYGDDAVRIYKRYAWLRYNLLDYIYAAAIDAHETGTPLMRPLALAFPGEPALAGIDDAYMFGDDLLVAPVTHGGGKRRVPFPSGRWTNLLTGDTVEGGNVKEIVVPLDEMPVYVRHGGMIPAQLNHRLAWGGSLTADRVGALVVTAPARTVARRSCTTPGDCAGFSSTPTADGFRVEMRGRGLPTYLLIYDATVAGVSANGAGLSELKTEERASRHAGWFADGRRTIVRLPEGVHHAITIRTRG